MRDFIYFIVTAILIFCIANILIVVKFNIFSYSILFYEYNLLSFFTVLACAVLLRLFSNSSQTARSTFSKSAVLAIFMLYAFNMTFVTNTERSLSVNILSSISNANQGIPLSRLRQDVDNFFVRNGGFDKRIQEQLATQTIIVRDDFVYISKNGLFLYHLNNLIARLFCIKGDNYDDKIYEF